MAKQANRMMIGGFVVIAMIIMAASLVVFGSGKFFKKTNKYVLYFDESVRGLSVGAPVLYQGVQVGSVVSIVIQADVAKLKTHIPIIIEIEPEKFQVGEEGREALRNQKPLAKLVEKGLRAVLTMQSFITGQLVIELDFYPDSPLCYPPAQIDKEYKDYIVIPTCKSTSSRLAQALGDLDLKGIERSLLSALVGIDRFINNPDLTASLRALKDALQDARGLITRVDRQVDPLADDLKKTVKDFGKLAGNVDARVAPLATGLDKTMSGVRGVVSEDAPLMVELENTLKEISAMTRSIRQLADYLEQHPETLIRGKEKPGGKKQ